jgi:hypothetical protein
MPHAATTQQEDDRPLTRRIPEYLRVHPHSTAEAIAEALGSTTKNSVSTTLSVLKKDGKVNNGVDGHTDVGVGGRHSTSCDIWVTHVGHDARQVASPPSRPRGSQRGKRQGKVKLWRDPEPLRLPR